MARRLILLVASDNERLRTWHRHARGAGHLVLPASTITQATIWVRKVRPALVLTEVEFSDGHVVGFLQEMRAIARLEHVHVVIIGVLQDEEHDHLQRDPHVHIRQVDHDDRIHEVLGEFLSAA